MLGAGLVRRGDAHQLDLGELVLANHAARILAGRARLGAEARRERREAQRQFLLVQHHVVHQVGERDLGRRDQPEAVVGAEHVLGELRQLADAIDGRILHQQRRIDLGVATLDRVQIEHELRQRALQPREMRLQHHEPGAGDLHGSGEIHLAGGLAQRHVILGREAEVALVAFAADLDIAGLVGALGHVVERQVRHHFEPDPQFLVETAGLVLAVLQALFERGDLGHQRIGVLALALGHADLLAERLALRLDGLALGDGRAAALVDLQDLGRQRRQAPLLQAGVESLGRLADEPDVMHG